MTQKRLQQTRSSRLVSARLDSGPNFESACGGSTPPGATSIAGIFGTRMNTGIACEIEGPEAAGSEGDRS